MPLLQKITLLSLTLTALTACQTSQISQNPQPKNPKPYPWQSPSHALTNDMSLRAKIVQVAKDEHQTWGSPFLDTNGRLAKYRSLEADHVPLANGNMAWQQVMSYWYDSGALQTVPNYENLRCQSVGLSARHNSCRFFVLDVAWSAAFISYVMTQAGVPDFAVSARHFDYLAQAYRGVGAYRLGDPKAVSPQLGDMLCYVRGRDDMTGFADFSEYLASAKKWLPAHCDIVVEKRADELWLIGGNVLNGVTLRKIATDDKGVAILPPKSDEPCTPADETACNFNRQTWVAVMSLKE